MPFMNQGLPDRRNKALFVFERITEEDSLKWELFDAYSLRNIDILDVQLLTLQ